MKLKPKPVSAEVQRTNQLDALQRKLGPIEYVAIDSLTPYEGNPRKHPEKQIIKLMPSLREFGVAMPILIDVHNVVIAGHAVLEAAKRLGIKNVPVLVADQWSSAQVRAYRLSANRLAELSHWDDALLKIELAAIIEFDEIPFEILGWETGEADLIQSADDPSASEDPADVVPEVGGEAVTKPGDLWYLGKHRLLCASSLEPANWAMLMDGAVAAMAFTDAPYNVPISGHVSGLGKKKHAEFQMASGEMSQPEFTGFLTKAVEEMAANLLDGAVFVFFMDWRHLSETLEALAANDLPLINLCVWNKNNGGMGSLYRSKHELAFIAKKGRAPHTNNVELGRHGRYRTNVWDYAGVNSFGRNRDADLADHPTVKPVALVADAIRDVTNPGDLVIDGFMGSGTTILAAERTKRVAAGIDIEPGYIDVAIRRWEAMTGLEATLADTDETFAEVAARRLAEAETAPEAD
jgi:DNA modification methylase